MVDKKKWQTKRWDKGIKDGKGKKKKEEVERDKEMNISNQHLEMMWDETMMICF